MILILLVFSNAAPAPCRPLVSFSVYSIGIPLLKYLSGKNWGRVRERKKHGVCSFSPLPHSFFFLTTRSPMKRDMRCLWRNTLSQTNACFLFKDILIYKTIGALVSATEEMDMTLQNLIHSTNQTVTTKA